MNNSEIEQSVRAKQHAYLIRKASNWMTKEPPKFTKYEILHIWGFSNPSHCPEMVEGLRCPLKHPLEKRIDDCLDFLLTALWGTNENH
jgi:hypothetical protein